MDILGDYIYLIMIGAAIISGIIKRKSQAKSIDAIPEEEYNSTDYEQDIETYTYETVRENTSSRSESYEMNVEGKINYENTSDTQQLKIKKEQIKHKEQIIKVEEPNEFESTLPKFDHIDEVRNAFIASEIFSRKYN